MANLLYFGVQVEYFEEVCFMFEARRHWEMCKMSKR